MHKIKAQQFYTDFSLYQQCLVLQKLAEFKDFLRLLSDFSVLFKAHLIQDRSQNSSTFQACVNPVHVCNKSIYLFPFLWQLWDKAGSILPYLSAIAPHHRLSTWTEVCGLEVLCLSISSTRINIPPTCNCKIGYTNRSENLRHKRQHMRISTN